MSRPRPEALISAKGLSLGYGGTPVCAPVSFSLRPGDVLAVVGANGSGKSTLLRTVLGLLPALDGTLDVLGAPVDERAVEFRRSVGPGP